MSGGISTTTDLTAGVVRNTTCLGAYTVTEMEMERAAQEAAPRPIAEDSKAGVAA